MSRNGTKVSMLQIEISIKQKRIDAWSRQVEELQEKISDLNRWINLEQDDIGTANEMIAKLEDQNETA